MFNNNNQSNNKDSNKDTIQPIKEDNKKNEAKQGSNISELVKKFNI